MEPTLNGAPFRLAGQVDDLWHEEHVEEPQQGHRHHACQDEAPERGLMPFLEIDHIHEGWNTQQVEQVHADGETDEESDEDNPSCALRVVGHLLPLQDGPEGDGGEERRHGVDFALHGVEPERFGEGVGHGTDKAGQQHTYFISPRCVFALFHPHLACHHRDGPEEEDDGEAAANGRHRVDHHGHLGDVAARKEREETPNHLE